ncbi:TetR family transcriptional regulator [Marinibaculum pumilum]|uniref:TetR family transcriptional regulator n=1 Tax=Marinibaculum pumilum TaxID=1766165 RepID=A0ABV7L041_9PROT
MGRRRSSPQGGQQEGQQNGEAAAGPDDTRQRLLDAAGPLVAQYGFDGPSVRDITTAAGVRLAAVSDIFGGIEGLLRAVVERHAPLLATERRRRLQAARAAGPLSLEAVTAAFAAPLLTFMTEDAAWRDHARIAAQLIASTRWDARLGPLLEAEAPDFLDAIREAEPRLDPADAAWCLTFAMGVLAAATSGTGWLKQLSDGEVSDDDPGALRDDLCAYLPAAMRGVAEAIESGRRDGPPIPKLPAAGTRDRILDAAERLFAAHGFHGVSMRTIARGAGISSGLCHYHFKTKDGVFLAMCLRRHPAFNEERWQLLEEARSMPPGRARLATVVESHLGSGARRLQRGGRGWRNHIRAMATAITSHGDYWLQTLRVVADDIAHALVTETADAIPGLPMRQAYLSHLFANGLMAAAYSGGARLQRLSGGLAKGSDYRAMHDRLLRFQVGGILGMAAAADRPAPAQD